MENQESGNPSTTEDDDGLGDPIYYDSDGGGEEKSKITKPYKPSLINHRNIAYNILKYLEDDMVENKEIPELGQCSECTNNVLTSPIKALTILSCGHIFHRSCIEKQLLYTKPSTCPFPDCGKNVNIIVDPKSTRKGSQSSQSSGTSALTNLIGEKFVMNSPVILEEGGPEDSMDVDPEGNIALMSMLLSGREQRSSKITEVAKETSNQATNPKCEKCSEDITIDLQKDTAFLSCKHAVHLDCINDLRKRCPTCTSTDDMETDNLETSGPSGMQKKRPNKSSEKSSSKKRKTSNKDDVSTMLKKLIEELLTDIPNTGEVLEETNAPDASSNTEALGRMKFLYLSDMIDQAETKNRDATRNVISKYFDFGEALYLRYKELKPSYGKDGAKALVEEEVRKQIPETKFSDEALRKRRGRSEKAYKLFNSIGKSKIGRIRSFPARSILNLSDINVDRVIAGVLRAERN